jgi:hypothetical protein
MTGASQLDGRKLYVVGLSTLDLRLIHDDSYSIICAVVTLHVQILSGNICRQDCHLIGYLESKVSESKIHLCHGRL